MLHHNTSMIQARYQLLQINASLGTWILDPVYQASQHRLKSASHVSLRDSVASQLLHFTSAHVYIDCYAYAVQSHCCLANQYYRALLHTGCRTSIAHGHKPCNNAALTDEGIQTCVTVITVFGLRSQVHSLLVCRCPTCLVAFVTSMASLKVSG